MCHPTEAFPLVLYVLCWNEVINSIYIVRGEALSLNELPEKMYGITGKRE